MSLFQRKRILLNTLYFLDVEYAELKNSKS